MYMFISRLNFRRFKACLVLHIFSKKELEASAILDPPFWMIQMYSILLHFRIEIKEFFKRKLDLNIKVLWRQKSAKDAIPR